MKHLLAAFEGRGNAGTYIAVLVLGVLGWLFIGSFPMAFAMIRNRIFNGNMSMLQEILPANEYIVLLLSSFVIALIIFMLLVKSMNHRGFASVVNGRNRLRWRHFFIAFVFYFIMMSIFHAIMLFLENDNFVFQFNAEAFLKTLPILLLMVPLQTLFEEYLFRGYLMQATTVFCKRIWIVWLLPAVLFALAHTTNPEVGAYGFWMMMSQYLLLALIFGLFTLADDGLEVSWGMHTANNLFLLLFFTEPNSAMPTPAVWCYKNASPSFLDPLEILIFGVVLWFLFKRIFNWKFPALGYRIDKKNLEKNI